MVQVFIVQVARPQKQNLQLLGVRDELSKQRNLLGLVILWLRDFVKLIGAGGMGLTWLVVVLVQWIPVDEEVRYWAVILSKVGGQRLQLRMSQPIVAELQCLDNLC